MGATIWKFLLVVSDHNECLVRSLAEGVYYFPHALSVLVVQSMQGFVKNEKFWVFDECSCQQAKALFTAGEFQECFVANVLNAEYADPDTAYVLLFWAWFAIQSHAVRESACHYVDGRKVAEICTMHLW